jgi:glutathione S-transferase
MEDEFHAQVRKALNDEVLPRHLAHLERKLSASTTGWVARGGASH